MENEKSYIAQFDSAEAYIRARVTSRMTRSITKNDIIELMNTKDKSRDCHKMTKVGVFDALVETYGNEAYRMFPVGISSIDWQRKFNIEHRDVLKMALKGFIAVTGSVEFSLYGKRLEAPTYSPFDFFRLTPEEVHAWLDAQPKRGKKKARAWIDKNPHV